MSDYVYKAHAVKIHATGMGSAVIVRDILNEALPLSPELLADVTAPNSTPDHVAFKARKPKLTFSTYDLTGVLDAIGVVGLGIESGANPGVVLYLQKFDDFGQAVSGANHRSYTLGRGCLVPKTLSCDHQGDFKLDCEMTIIGDTVNSPVTLSDTATLPTITQLPARWTLGKIVVAGITLGEYTNVSIDFGNTADSQGSASNVDDSHIAQRTHEPMITITGIDPKWFAAASIPINGAVAVNATDRIYLRKRTQDEDHFVGDGTATHIAVALAGLAAIDQACQVQATRISETTLVIKGAKDSSGNMPLIVDTTSTIS
jgi:hypothetical protein